MEGEDLGLLATKGLIVTIGSQEIKGVLFSSLLGRTRVERMEASTSIEGLLAAFPADAAITLMLPGYMFMARQVALPFANAKTIRQTLPFAIEGIIPFAVEEVLVDSVRAVPTDTGSNVIALAIPKRIVADSMRLFPAGRMPERVIPDFVSLLSFGMKMKGEKGLYGILNIGHESVSIVVMSEGIPLLMRSVETGRDGAFTAEWVDATIGPLRQQGKEIATLYVHGEAARDTLPLLEWIAAAVPLPEVVSGVGGGEWHAWSILAGGAFSASEFPRFNILGPHPESGRRSRVVRTLWTWAVVMLILGTTDLYVRYASASRAVSALRAESKAVFLTAMPHVTKVVKEDTQMKVALVKEKATREALMGNPAPSYLTVSKGLQRLVSEHPEVKVREAVLSSDGLSVAGDGSGIAAEGLKKVFSEVSGAQDVQMEEIVQGIDPNSYRFRLNVRVR